jgi:hypothetical protein
MRLHFLAADVAWSPVHMTYSGQVWGSFFEQLFEQLFEGIVRRKNMKQPVPTKCSENFCFWKTANLKWLLLEKMIIFWEQAILE